MAGVRCSLTSHASRNRVLTSMARGIHTMPPWDLRRSASVWTCPRSRSYSTDMPGRPASDGQPEPTKPRCARRSQTRRRWPATANHAQALSLPGPQPPPRCGAEFPWPVWPLAGQARLGQNTVMGFITVLPALHGSVPRGVCLDPHVHYKCISPRFSGELPMRESM
jgi:hypothetical protein